MFKSQYPPNIFVIYPNVLIKEHKDRINSFEIFTNEVRECPAASLVWAFINTWVSHYYAMPIQSINRKKRIGFVKFRFHLNENIELN
jgi:hypothetical protein